MQRSYSWPQLRILDDDREKFGEYSIEQVGLLGSIEHTESECRCEFGMDYRVIMARVEEMENEIQCLMTENASLKQNCRLSTERVDFLERERNVQQVQIRELESVISDLQNDCEEAGNDNRLAEGELTRWRNGFDELECSKKDLEEQVHKLQSSENCRREEVERYNKLLQEHDSLRAEVQQMQQHVQIKESDSHQLRAENHEMEIQISQVVQQNIQLMRQLNDVIKNRDCLEKHVEALRNEINLKIESGKNREVSPSIQCVMHNLGYINDGNITNQYASDSEGEEQTLEYVIPGNHPARTPLPISLAEELEFAVTNCHSPREDKDEAKAHDALDEYLHLTVAAVKIRFHMVSTFRDELIKKAKNIPFYKAHEELTLYMQEKQQEQERASTSRHDQDNTQQQEPVCKEDKDISSLVPSAQFSLVNKVFRRLSLR